MEGTGTRTTSWNVSVFTRSCRAEVDGFGRNSSEPPFHVRYDSCEDMDAAYRAFGPRCLNCAEDIHFARECPAIHLNRSGLIYPVVGDGTPNSSLALWRRWRQRLCQWHAGRPGRAEVTEGTTVSGPTCGQHRCPRCPVFRAFRVFSRVVRAGTGQPRRGESEDGGEALPAFPDARMSTAGAVAHNTGPGQEAGYHLHGSDKSGGVVGSRPSVLLGSNYPDCRSSASTVTPPLCTSAVGDSSTVTDELGRPSRVRASYRLGGSCRELREPDATAYR